MKEHRGIRIIVLFIMLLLGIAFLGQATHTHAQVDCQVDYSVVNQWNDGFQANVSITNNGNVQFISLQNHMHSLNDLSWARSMLIKLKS